MEKRVWRVTRVTVVTRYGSRGRVSSTSCEEASGIVTNCDKKGRCVHRDNQSHIAGAFAILGVPRLFGLSEHSKTNGKRIGASAKKHEMDVRRTCEPQPVAQYTQVMVMEHQGKGV